MLTAACEAEQLQHGAHSSLPNRSSNPNPQLHFQRAHVLVSLGLLAEALVELEGVRVAAPREPPVHVLLGQVRLECWH